MDRRNRPHTRIALSLLILALLMPVGGCGGLTAGTSPSLIEPNLDPATITRIQIMPDYNGNPRGSNPAKDITNPQEIAAFVAAFQIPLPSSLLQVMQVPSRALKQDMAVSVYLPAGYGEHGDSRDSYPVLYMLHGYTGSETTWMPGLKLQETADTLIADGSIGPLIIIAPNIDNSYGIDSAEEPSQLGSSPRTA